MSKFSVPEFLNREEEYKFLAQNRWPDGKIFCPTCANANIRTLSQGYYYCAACVKNGHNGKFNAASGTALSRYKIRLSGFLYAALSLNMGGDGLSVADLATKLNISLATANLIIKKLCRLNDSGMGYILGAYAPKYSRKYRAKNHRSAELYPEIPGIDCRYNLINGIIEQSMDKSFDIFWVATWENSRALTGYGPEGLQYEITRADAAEEYLITKEYWHEKKRVYCQPILTKNSLSAQTFATVAAAQAFCEQDYQTINNPFEIEWLRGEENNVLFGFNNLDQSTYNIFQRKDQSCFVLKNLLDGGEELLKTHTRLSLEDAQNLCLADLKKISAAAG